MSLIGRHLWHHICFGRLLVCLLLLRWFGSHIFPAVESSTYTVPLLFKIRPYAEECFTLRVPPVKPKTDYLLQASYEIVDDVSTRNINAVMIILYEYKTEKVKAKRSGKSRGILSEALPGGTKWWLCVQNSLHAPDSKVPEGQHPDMKTRTVGLHYHLDISKDTLNWAVDRERREQEEHMAHVASTLWKGKGDNVLTAIRRMLHHHSYMKAREAHHRLITEKTFTDILTWFLAEAVLVVLVAVGQIFYFRRFLEKKSRFMY